MNPQLSEGIAPRLMRTQTEQLLQQATTMTEIALELKERTALAEKYVCYLRSLSVRTGRVVTAMQQTGKSLLINAHKLTNLIKQMDTSPEPCFSAKIECDKLIGVLEKEIAELDDFESIDASLAAVGTKDTIASIAQKIRYFEEKQRSIDSPVPPRTSSVRSFKADVDEKYPESLCRENLLELSSSALASVPEDGRSLSNWPNTRSASLCSLKSFRKVKLMLQRADSADPVDPMDDSTSTQSEDSQAETENNANWLQVGNNKGSSLDNIQEEIQDHEN